MDACAIGLMHGTHGMLGCRGWYVHNPAIVSFVAKSKLCFIAYILYFILSVHSEYREHFALAPLREVQYRRPKYWEYCEYDQY